ACPFAPCLIRIYFFFSGNTLGKDPLLCWALAIIHTSKAAIALTKVGSIERWNEPKIWLNASVTPVLPGKNTIATLTTNAAKTEPRPEIEIQLIAGSFASPREVPFTTSVRYFTKTLMR